MLAALDWWVIGTYLFLLLALGGFLSRRQQSGADYFVAGRSEQPFSIALSVLATQCSTNSILGAPAFVAFAADAAGGHAHAASLMSRARARAREQ